MAASRQSALGLGICLGLGLLGHEGVAQVDVEVGAVGKDVRQRDGVQLAAEARVAVVRIGVDGESESTAGGTPGVKRVLAGGHAIRDHRVVVRGVRSEPGQFDALRHVRLQVDQIGLRRVVAGRNAIGQNDLQVRLRVHAGTDGVIRRTSQDDAECRRRRDIHGSRGRVIGRRRPGSARLSRHRHRPRRRRAGGAEGKNKNERNHLASGST